MTRKVLLTFITLAVAACLVLICITSLGGLLLAANRSHSPLPKPTSTIIHPSQLPTPVEPESLPADIAAQMDTIQMQVIQIRGLTPLTHVPRSVLTPTELRKKVEEDFFADYSPDKARDNAMLLSTLGLLPPEYDLYNLLLDLYSEQVAGYYDTQTKKMYVVQGEFFGGMQRMTYAHEFTHALQDQHYDLEKGLKLNANDCEKASEYCAAVTALIEGDAVLTAQSWFSRYGSRTDRQQVQDFMSEFDSSVFDSAPLFLQKDLLFPYREGMEFAASLFDQQGQPAIDQAFSHPPVSTEQILHPYQYPGDTPDDIASPQLDTVLGKKWRIVDQNSLGEWYTYLMLAYGWREETRLPSDSARKAAAGWEGDAYTLLHNSETDRIIFVLRSIWQTPNDARELWEALAKYGSRRWGTTPVIKNDQHIAWQDASQGYISISINALETRWVIAPDQTTANLFLAAMK